MNTKAFGFTRSSLWIAALLAPASTLAAEWQFSGFVREEIAVRVGGEDNPANQQGNVFNGKAVPNTGLGPFLAPGVAPATLTRPGSLKDSNTFNMFATRVELAADGKLSESLAAHVKLRGFYDGIGQVDGAFRKENLFEQEFRGSRGGTPFEVARKDWMLDIPAAYLDYNDGPLWLRFGNQQIAWGESIFFRVLDVPNGIDLRRHSILDVAAEEYSDKRVPSLALRGSFRVNNDWEVEGFTQRFQPTILPGDNSPYNTIPSQFAVQERAGYDKVKDDWTFGGRVRGKLGDFGVQLMAVNRRNPDGVVKWTDSRKGVLANTAFEAGTGQGIYSAAEWFHYASLVGLDGIGGLESALNEFPATLGLGSAAVAAGCGGTVSGGKISLPNKAATSCVLDTFFDPVAGLGNLRGHIAREFPRENVFGFSVNHVFEGEPDSFLDQLVGRFELSWTPDKKFTNPTLSRRYVEENETQFAFIVEKYHKFSADIPATYIVAQWLHKTASDLFGRHLSGLDNKPGERPKGLDSFNAVALAIQQPSKTLEWRGDLTMLTDLRGGWLIQPGVKWKPNKSFQLDLYGNILRSDGGGDDFGANLQSANEVFMRGTFYF
ncbi:DUF1302 domain-containing protein [Aromatoleum toluolicum]|uniref:DUF1302 family protein n=1 Tax=Aromatoleum toluolicum TaxID=90060 RepID=A0ABX1NI80_9RHOO|nr:DUF1302 family protein [Aromatoleum toluolicum]NMF98858.1 DUF1302 domain-containing protein [Aromatoleum toluolicum]